ncbi:MAG: 4-(cytidine 5'-diphospho)-2-C-methyl-D-erythritol kinase [Kiritimatiellia bacterium]
MRDLLMTLEAHAKINLTLEVLGRRPDGYHDLRSVVVPIPLHDDLTLEAAETVAVSGCPQIPMERNLAFRAAVLLRQVAGRPDGVSIALVKRIPSGAGLGGGSADAAAVLNGLNAMWGLGIAPLELAALGAQIGSDVPALVLGGPVLMEGRGERVSALPAETMPDFSRLVLRVPPVFCSTPEVFRAYRPQDRGLGRNDLQPAACRLHPEIAQALAELEAEGCRDVQMSGSGSAVFGWRPAR